MNRRTFLAGFAAALALHRLPKQLSSGVFSLTPASTNVYTQIDPRGSALWTRLYELDPFMRVSMDYKNYGFHLSTRVPVDLVTEVLWNYKDVGVMATINGVYADFSSLYAKWYDHELPDGSDRIT